MTRPVVAFIDVSALRHNLSKVRAYAPNSEVMAVVKANAYGHGLANACRAFSDADIYGMLDVEEAVDLRQSGVDQRICLLEGFFTEDEIALLAEHRLEPVIHSKWQIDQLEKNAGKGPLTVWLKVDSGMNRLGFSLDEAEMALNRLSAMQQVERITLMSHLANADRADPTGTIGQLEKFRSFVGERTENKLSLANSAAVVAYPDCHLDVVRPGIMLYGSSPREDKTAADLDIKPAMQLRSEIISIKKLKKGDTVGYGSTWVCPEDMRIAVVACGYGDGYPRHAPTGTPVSVAGIRTRLVGRVSMDMITVDLRGVDAATVGSPVELWGTEIPVDTVASMSGTISYELLCGITSRVSRREVSSG